ncbi:(Fe-S)-binding protein [Archaeoglobus neptunius]|uniref:(Fe-S)-binding protein n=1 Tax=Archaeoglobus neptunius TaxID=2798580 RepID=UPI0019287999|nr:(Fe-S)-binding protein [Archaeoglobus neptunius]
MIRPEYMAGTLSKNLRKTGDPLGIGKEKINTWWKECEIRKKGEWFLFTGMLYQLTPYIEASVRFLEMIENSKFQKPLFFSKCSPLLNLITPRKAKREAKTILQNIHSLLMKSGVDVFYSPYLDFYSGALLYDLGCDRVFEDHAKFVCKNLKSAGIERIVTPDPHTTYTLKILYPRYTGVEFEVKSYIELLKDVEGESGEYVIHDPCYYGRYLELSDNVRNILNAAGVDYRETSCSKNMTNCCGGPIESLSPKISKEIARLRVEKLGNSKIITLCPICLANLRRCGGNAVDFSMVVK